MKRQKLELSLTQAEDLLRLPPVFQGSIGFQPVSCTERATTLTRPRRRRFSQSHAQ